jgi:Ca2+-binding EF-hand superfamily protein
MQRYLLVLSAAFLGIISISLCGCASSRPQQPAGPSYDVNGSGYVEPAELWDGLKKQSFVEMDSNGDRLIDRNEWVSTRKDDKTAGLFDTIDADKNGSISYAEYSAFSDKHQQDLNRLLLDLDSNNDGHLSDAEIRAKPVGTIFKWKF